MSPVIKPYLGEINEVYDRIRGFEAQVKLTHRYSPSEGKRQYAQDDIDAVISSAGSLDFDPAALERLRDALRADEVDFTAMTSGAASLPEDELQFFFIMARPFFRAMNSAAGSDRVFWGSGRCPVCGAVPSLSVIDKESQRLYVCSFCGCRGFYRRIGCPQCGNDKAGDITIISLEGEEGMRADTCEKCMSYCKTFEGPLMDDHTPDVLDIVSIPLDIVVQEKGFIRHSPNPLGIIRMVRDRAS